MNPVDAHVHLWDLARRPQPWIDAARSAIDRSFAPGDLDAALAGSGIDQAVLVQVLNDAAETADLAMAARQCARVGALVGWVDLAGPDPDGALESLQAKAGGLLRGVRHQALAEPDPVAWLTAPAVARGLGRLARHGLSFDLMVGPGDLAALPGVVRAHPALQFVLDHLGKPPVAEGALEPWASAVRALAAEPNVTVKLSGLVTVASWRRWDVDQLRPFVEVALAAFGPDRVMFGSDWPVCLVAARDHTQVLDAVRELLQGWDPGAAAQVLSGTARRVYRLGPPRDAGSVGAGLSPEQ